jgi:vacuolar-type H+-ATPase subunit C/Vma6
MIRTFRYAYVQAKIYGIMAKTYVGANFQDLLRLKKLEEIYQLLFPGQRDAGSSEPLPADLESRIRRAGVAAITDVLSMIGSPPPEILVHILRKYEYQSVKSLLRSISQQGKEEPQVWDLGKYSQLHLQDARDPHNAIAASPYAWVLERPSETQMFELENELDRDYYSRLLALAQGLPPRDRTGVLRLVRLEISLANVIWAMRLRFFFGLDVQHAQPLLIPGMVDTHKRAIVELFEIPADSAEGWRKWRFSWLVEDQLGEAFRGPDPVRAEQKAAQRLALRAHQLFHQSPFTLTPIAAYFKLKELETGMLKIAVEAARLSLPEHEVMAMVGAL